MCRWPEDTDLVPGVLVVHINRAAMILEPPSDETLRVKHEVCLYSCEKVERGVDFWLGRTAGLWGCAVGAGKR